ncbi:unnamed protein product [Pedinophyceae sp. YPF-701]|nr:unnamed protein product [Pedinophyceae sp. YPF-701]
MRLSKHAIKNASFGSEPESLHEFALTNKQIDDLGDLAILTNLRELNLSFNKVSSLQEVAKLSGLVSLNVMRNKVKTLAPLAEVNTLTVLKASNNEIKALEPLKRLTALKELWLQGNKISDPCELAHLSGCDALTHVVLRQNPVADMLGESYRPAVVRLLPKLAFLDGQPITDDDRARAQDAPDLATYAPGEAEDPILGAARSAAAAAQAAINGSMAEVTKTVAQNLDELRDMSNARMASGGRSGQNQASNGRQRYNVGARINTGAKAQRAEPSAEDLGIGDDVGPLAAVLGKLPEVAPVSKPGVYRQPKKPTRSAHVTEAHNERAHEVLYQAKYKGADGGAGTVGVSVRGDGAAMTKWPDGGVAVTVESSVEGNRIVFSAMAFFRASGNLAASFAPDGSGCLQWPNGQIRLTWNRQAGDGTLMTRDGRVERMITKKDEVVDVQLDDNLAFRICPPDGKVYIYFACGSLRHTLCLGHNQPCHVWDDAPAFARGLEDSNGPFEQSGGGGGEPMSKTKGLVSPGGKSTSTRLFEGLGGLGPGMDAALDALGSGLAAKIARLNQMDADAGIVHGAGETDSAAANPTARDEASEAAAPARTPAAKLTAGALPSQAPPPAAARDM